ncbi:MAG: NAD-dependent epimerase/dehydratase family protein, partial [Pirellulaceae bacterium]
MCDRPSRCATVSSRWEGTGVAQVERLRGASCLITGGLGFIGSNLAMRLVELGARVTLVDSLDERFGG